jgi:hypothetical protein
MATKYLKIPVPLVAPMGWEVDDYKMIQDVWDAFVKPSQSDNAPPQSAEMRVLMAVLRAVHQGLIDAEATS